MELIEITSSKAIAAEVIVLPFLECGVGRRTDMQSANRKEFPTNYEDIPFATIFPDSSFSTYAHGVFGSWVKTVSHFSGSERS